MTCKYDGCPKRLRKDNKSGYCEPHYQAHRHRVRSYESLRDRDLKQHYGISLADYNQLFASQEGKCGICKRHQSELSKSLCVDHCHVSSKVRGLLCTKCNLMIGNAQDNAATLRSGIEYLGGLQ